MKKTMLLHFRHNQVFCLFAGAVLFCAVALAGGGDTIPVRALQLQSSGAAPIRQYFRVHDFNALGAGADIKPWGGTLTAAHDNTAGKEIAVLAKEFTADSADRGISHNETVRMHEGQPYSLRIRYRTQMKGVSAQLHFYGFGTWGDTVANRITNLAPTGEQFADVKVDFVPAPGAICAGFWFGVAKGAAGRLEIASCSLEGAPWGGAEYPALPDKDVMWEAWEDVYNSVPINSQYFGKDAQRYFRTLQGRGMGEVWLPAGLVVPPQAGKYTVGLEVRELGEGPLIAAYAGTVNNAATGMSSERIRLPGLIRSAAVRLWCWDNNGVLCGERLVTVRLRDREPFKAPLLWVRPLATPAKPGAGRLSIDGTGNTVRDWQAGQPLVLTLRAADAAGVTAVRVRVENFDRSFVRKFALAAESLQKGAVVEFVPEAPDVYYLDAELTGPAGRLDHLTLALGLRDVAPAPAFVAPAVPAVVRSEDMNFPSPRYAPQARANFRAFLADIKQYGSNTAGLGYDLASLNPLPGVYRFHDLDEFVRTASAAGIKSEIFLYLHDGAWPSWAGNERAFDQNGADGGVLTPASDGVRAVVGAAYGKLAQHFRGTPDMIGYNFWNTWFDWTYRDNGERVYDYSPSALEKWRVLSGGLAAPSMPHTQADYLSPAWQKWAELRDQIIHLWVVEMLGGGIRAYDPERMICPYLMAGGHGRMEKLWPHFKKLKMQPAHGGSESRTFITHGALVRQYGLAYRHEDVEAPARHPLNRDLLVYHSLFNGLNQGGKPMWNTQWNLGWTFTHANPGVVNARERGRALYDIIEKMQAQGYALPTAKWALYDAWDNSALGGAHFQWYGLGADLELGRLYGSFAPDDVSDVTPLELWKKYGLVFANGSKMISQQTAQKILDYVDGGGVFALILTAGAAQQALRDKLGVKATEGEPLPQRLTVRGKSPFFSPGRSLLLHKPVRFLVPDEAKVMAVVEESDLAVAWELPYGEGRFLLFAGTVDAGASAGFLEDILEPFGVAPQIVLTSSLKNDPYPAEALAFKNKDGAQMVWVHRAVRWDRQGELIRAAKEKGAAPDFDGLAVACPRADITLTIRPERAGKFQVERWEKQRWSEPVTISGEELNDPALHFSLTAGEIGILRLTPKTDQAP